MNEIKNMKNISLGRGDIKDATYIDCTFSNCQHTRFVRCKFRNCKFKKTNSFVSFKNCDQDHLTKIL